MATQQRCATLVCLLGLFQTILAVYLDAQPQLEERSKQKNSKVSYNIIFSAEPKCPEPENIQNGGYTTRRPAGYVPYFPPNTTITYWCERGFQITGSDHSIERVCQSDLTWTGDDQLPSCVKESTSAPEETGGCIAMRPARGMYCHTESKLTCHKSSSLNRVFSVGETIVFQCQGNSTVLRGPKSALCQSRGWKLKSNKMPACLDK